MYYAIPKKIIDTIKKQLEKMPIAFASAPSFGENGRIYFYKDGMLMTRLMNKERTKSLEETEMMVI
jgi:hypothetical protein